MKFLMEMNSCCGRFDLRTGTLFILWGQLLLTIFDMVTLGSEMTYTTVQGIVTSYVVISSAILAVACALGIFGVGLDVRKQSFLIPYVVVELASAVITLLADLILVLLWLIDSAVVDDLADELYLKPLPLAGKRPSALPARFFVYLTFFIFTLTAVILWFFASVVHSYYLLLYETESAGRRRSIVRTYDRVSLNKPDGIHASNSQGTILNCTNF